MEINARNLEGNVTDYAFSWHVNEIPETDNRVLNNSTFIKSFDKAGEYVVRLVVSDLRGGIASKNIVIQVGDYHSTDRSIISERFVRARRNTGSSCRRPVGSSYRAYR